MSVMEPDNHGFDDSSASLRLQPSGNMEVRRSFGGLVNRPLTEEVVLQRLGTISGEMGFSLFHMELMWLRQTGK